MSEHDPSAGARRRRREDEREARLVAEQGGLALPLTRRELRRRELEEQARLEAIATGELPLLDEDGMPAGSEAVAARLSAAGTAPVADRGSTAEDTGSAGPSAEEPEASAPRRAPTGGSARRQEPTDGSAPPVVARRPVVPAPSSSNARTPSSPAEAVTSRRSMRERLREAADLAAAETAGPTHTGERTTTTRRPVVRTPRTARGIRRLDETGTLTGVQPVAHPATAPAPAGLAETETDVTTDPAGWESAVALPVIRDGHLTVPDADEPASAATPEQAGELVAPSATASAPVGPETVAAAALPPSDDEEARTAPTDGTDGSHLATSADGVPDEEWSDDVEPDDGVLLESGNPAASLVKIIALVLAAIVIGLLIGLLWFNNNDGGRAESGTETRIHSSAGAFVSGDST